MDTNTNIKLLGEILSHSFSGFNSTLDCDRLSVFSKSLKTNGQYIMLQTRLLEDVKYAFKTVVLNLEDYLGYNKEKIDYSLLYSFLDEEKNKALKTGSFENATIISYVKKRIFEIEKSEKGTNEIVELFQLLPPYKLMKYDIKENGDNLLLTVVTAFEPYLRSLREMLGD